MTKEETLTAIATNKAKLEEIRAFFTTLRFEDDLQKFYPHGGMKFFLTAVDFLTTNLTELENKIRMS